MSISMEVTLCCDGAPGDPKGSCQLSVPITHVRPLDCRALAERQGWVRKWRGRTLVDLCKHHKVA